MLVDIDKLATFIIMAVFAISSIMLFPSSRHDDAGCEQLSGHSLDYHALYWIERHECCHLILREKNELVIECVLLPN